jgi:hypothetical protein
MERLISLFKRPDEFEFAEFAESAYPYPWLDANGEDGEPEYFVQLMQYLRDERQNAQREGAD